VEDSDQLTEQVSISRRDFLTTSGKLAAGVATAASLSQVVGATSALARGMQSPTSITFWFFDPWVKSPISVFEEKHANVNVNFVLMGYVDNHEKLLTSLAAGSGAPDVVGIDIGYIGVFTAKGGLTNLLASPYSAGRYKKDFVPYKWQEGSTPDHRLVGMPWDIGPGALWYRPDHFKSAGLSTDPSTLQKQLKTWDQLFAAGERLKKKGIKLFADPVGDIFNVGVEQQGHGWFKGNKVVIVQKAVKPLQRAVQARKLGLVADLSQGSPEWATGIRRGVFATAMNACWAQISWQRDFPEVVGKWRAIYPPGGAWAVGGGFVAIPAQSKQKAAAWQFAEFLTASRQGANVGFKTAGGPVPSYTPAWKDASYRYPVVFFGGQRVNELWLSIARRVPSQQSSPYDRQANDIVLGEVDNVMKLGKDPVKAMHDAQNKVLQQIPGTHT